MLQLQLNQSKGHWFQCQPRLCSHCFEIGFDNLDPHSTVKCGKRSKYCFRKESFWSIWKVQNIFRIQITPNIFFYATRYIEASEAKLGFISAEKKMVCNGQYWRAFKICESRESNWFLQLVHHQETHGHPAYANIFSAWAFTCLSNPQRVFQIINIHLFCLSEVREGKETIIALEDS